MTLEELKTRCEALASVGDEQARCTLAYLFDKGRAEKEVVELREKNQILAEGNVRMKNELSKLKWDQEEAATKKRLENAVYFLKKIEATMIAAKALGLLAEPEKKPEEGKVGKEQAIEESKNFFSGVLVGGKPVDGVAKRELANVPDMRQVNAARQGKRGHEAMTEDVKRNWLEHVEGIAKEFGISTSEAVAVDATRRANGLAAAASPGTTTANPEMKTGGYEKVPGDTSAEGNKE